MSNPGEFQSHDKAAETAEIERLKAQERQRAEERAQPQKSSNEDPALTSQIEEDKEKRSD